MLKITMIGNLGTAPDLRYTPAGEPVCSFSLASSEKRRDRNGDMREEVTWARITFWRKQAETASQYLAKGKPVYIEGRGRIETWTDRDGKPRTTLEVSGTELQLIAPRDDTQNRGTETRPPVQQPRAPARTEPPPLSLDPRGDVPF